MLRRLGVAAWLMLAASCTRSAGAPAAAETLQIALVAGDGAQVAPMSLTASDGTGLSLRELQAKVVLEPPLAFTQLELAFQNPDSHRIEGRFEIALPPGASISRLALQFGDHYEEGEVVQRPKATAAYEEALHGRRDPALLEHDAGNEYRLRVFPIEAHEIKHVIVSYSQLIDDGDGAYRLPLTGLPQIDRVHAEFSCASGKTARAPQVFERRNWQPSGDVEVRSVERADDRAVVSGDLALLHVRPATQSRPATLERLTLLLDTSASAAAGFELRIQRLRALLDALNQARGSAFPLQLVVFDQEFVPLLETRSDQLGPELEAQLRARGALGATDLDAALGGLGELDGIGDRVIVYSDGIATAGATDSATLAGRAAALAARGVQRLDVVTYGAIIDRPALEALVHAELPEAGVIAPDDDAAATAQRLLRGTERRVDIEVEGAEWTYPQVLAGVEPDRAYPIFAKVRDPKRLELRAGAERVRLNATQTQAAALFEREWARARIAYLEHKLSGSSEADAAPVRERIIDLSVRHRVLSDATAWVVLQSESDYERHAIARSSAPLLEVSNGALIATRDKQAVAADPGEEPWLRYEPRMAGRAERVQEHSAFGRSEPPSDAASAGIIGVLRARPLDGNEARNGTRNSAAAPASWLETQGGGAAFGGMRGTGRGGGGDTIGMIPTIGHAAHGALGAGGTAMGFGRGAGMHRHIPNVPVVRSGRLDRRGSLSKEVIRRIVQRHRNEVVFCDQQALNVAGGGFEGRVAVKFIISPTGAVQAAALSASTIEDVGLEQCIVDAVKRWTFPSPDDGGIVVATQVFELNQAGEQISRRSYGTDVNDDSYDAWALRQQQTARREEQARRARERDERQSALREVQARRAREWNERPQPIAADALTGEMREVVERIEADLPADALASARAYRALHPTDTMALLALARAAAANGDHVLAARAYGSLIDLFPSRAELRRAAGQGLEELGHDALALAIDSYRKAVALRPDHLSGHRMLAFALWRAGDRDGARAALEQGRARTRVERWRPPGSADLFDSDLQLANDKRSKSLIRICLYWENDASDLDLSVYDGTHRHIPKVADFRGGPTLLADVQTGYGPECMTASGEQIAFPYLLQVQYAVPGPTGDAIGAVHITQVDAHGKTSFEMRPFVVMKTGAFVALGTVQPPHA